ncbi:MAG: mercuric reductase [Armatimonadia bacterium]|nr:mercuric reductase [Armatimonadia bacterium]
MAQIKCDLAVIGTGAAGLVAGTVAGGLGFKVCTVERDRIGGECTWTGCVPSKALLHSAEVAWKLRHGPWGGVSATVSDIDVSDAMEFARSKSREIAAEATPEKLRESRGFDVLMGEPRLEPDGIVRVGDDILDARQIILTTGSHPFVPPIEGLDEVDYLTNESLWELESIPESMIIIGAGPIGMEMGQAFNRLGTDVTVLEQGDQVLHRDDHELANCLRDILIEEGVTLLCGAEATSVSTHNGRRVVAARVDGQDRTLTADELLIAVGRRANVEALGLEDVGVAFSEHAVQVNRYMRTTNERIWAAGDITGAWQFSHMAEAEATTAVRNALFPLADAMDYSSAGWCTFTDPELASCGMNEREADEQGIRHCVYRFGFHEDDRSRTDQQDRGEIKVIADPKTGRIHGAQILGPHAGELIQEYIIAMAHGVPVSELGRTVHVYPTYSMAAQRAAQMYWDEFGRRDSIQRYLGWYTSLTGWQGTNN